MKVIAFLLMLMIAAAGLAEAGPESVVFGRYEQDNDLSNGPEPIEWRVLKTEGDSALLISRYALDAMPYNETGGMASWVMSSLREWLNQTFYTTAFTDEERSRILITTMKNWHEHDTTDPVFLLDNDQAKHLFSSHADRMAKPTEYAEARWAYVSREYGPGNTHWWLRTISWEHENYASFVATSGGVMTCGGESLGVVEYPRITVRPCIWLNLSGFQQDPSLVPYRRMPKALITNDVVINVRQEPDAGSKKVGTASPNQTFPMLGRAENGWLQIQLDNGTIGYVSPKTAKEIE